MKSLIKFLGFAAVIVLAGLWIMTLMKTCDKNKLAEVPNLETGISDKVTEVKDDVESLFEGETEEEGLFNEDGDEISGNTEGATLLDESEEDEDEYEEDDDEDLADLKDEIAARTNASNADRTAASSSNSSSSTSKRSSSSGVEYLVIGGAYLTEVNAKAEVRRLKKKGYDGAEVVTFDYSQYHSVCVKRTGSLSDANATKSKLVKAGNAEAYVHKKRSGKKK